MRASLIRQSSPSRRFTRARRIARRLAPLPTTTPARAPAPPRPRPSRRRHPVRRHRPRAPVPRSPVPPTRAPTDDANGRRDIEYARTSSSRASSVVVASSVVASSSSTPIGTRAGRHPRRPRRPSSSFTHLITASHRARHRRASSSRDAIFLHRPSRRRRARRRRAHRHRRRHRRRRRRRRAGARVWRRRRRHPRVSSTSTYVARARVGGTVRRHTGVNRECTMRLY